LQPLILLILILFQRSFVSSVILSFTEFKSIQLEQSLIYGVSNVSINLAKALRDSNTHLVCGFINEFNKIDKAQEVLGIKIYNIENIESLVNKHSIKSIIFTKNLDSFDEDQKDLILEKILNLKLKILTVNNLLNLDSQNFKGSILKNIDIEDLLKRKAIAPIKDLLLRNNYKKNILITGAAGSIGSEISKQILKLSPNKVILLDNNEFEIYNLKNFFFSEKNTKYNFILGDINDEILIKNILRNEQIDTIYHCAAYKHVPILEENVFSCLKNNILGTYNLLKLSQEFRIKNFVFISTDKAVNAENIMGKSKKFCEIIIKSISKNPATNSITQFSIVRFGNVVDSRGSVLPLFKEQIKNKTPITLTDLNMKRFFMTIPEAAELVIQAGSFKSLGDIFVLDMGKEIRIYDLIKKLLKINNLSLKDTNNVNGDIEIKIIGLRPGEKLSEELVSKEGHLEATEHPRIMRVVENTKLTNDIDEKIKELKGIIDNFDHNQLHIFLSKNLS
jgi:FlaA1/EpsC-like NDP-sugar epimerase